MEQYINTLKDKINREIQFIELQEGCIFQGSAKTISLLENAFDELKEFISVYVFKNQEDEIRFFKEIKPQLYSILIYYRKIYNLEMRMPTGSHIDKRNYLEGILCRIKYFFEVNSDFYQYYRSASTYLDKYYFLRGKPEIQITLDSFYFERDARFSTNCDYKVAKMIANEKLTAYINEKLSKLNQIETGIPISSSLPKVKLTWTAKKAELVEQIYAWEQADCFNNGNVTIKELAEYLEQVFNINLGDFYHTFLEMRNRKGSRTIFLDKLIKLLNDRMDETDNK